MLRVPPEAVWPGWGHASENPRLSIGLRATRSASQPNLPIVFIGPPAKPMHALGDKIGSTIIAQSAGVPTIAWNGAGVTMNYKEVGEVTAEVYRRGQVLTAAECQSAAATIGFPVMIKASEGGGGKGIRMVHEPALVADAFRQVQV